MSILYVIGQCVADSWMSSRSCAVGEPILHETTQADVRVTCSSCSQKCLVPAMPAALSGHRKPLIMRLDCGMVPGCGADTGALLLWHPPLDNVLQIV